MRIAMLTWEFPPRVVGGLAMHVRELSGNLVRLGADVTVITCHAFGVPDEEIVEGVKVVRVHPYDVHSRDIVGWAIQLNVAMLEKAVHLVTYDGLFDLVHAHDWLVAYTGRALKHAYQIPLVATVHATEYGRNNGLHNDIQRNINSIEWWLTFEAWKVICCSGYMVDEVRRVFALPPDKVVNIPNGVNAERIRKRRVPPGFKNRFALPHEKIIYFVGRLVQEKGVQVLIDAAPKILSYCPDAKFVIAGTGPFEGFLKQKAWDMGLKDKMYFAGYLNDEDRDMLYLTADVAVFPSLYEPFGIVALEAMAAGTPVVVSDNGGLAEIVENEVDGLYAITGSAESLADRVLEILFNPGLAKRLSDKAYQKVCQKFDWQVIAAKTLEVYQGVLRESRRTGFMPISLENRPWGRSKLLRREVRH